MGIMYILRRCHAVRRPDFTRSVSMLSTQETLRAEPLEDRGLLKVSGSDVYGFIQGLMTNDISHIQPGLSSMYSMFLNTRGRILYDTIIYQTTKAGVLLIECDSSVISSLAKHIQLYRLRKKVDIHIVEDQKVWTVYDPSQIEERNSVNLVADLKDKLIGRVLPCQELELSGKEKIESFIVKSSSLENNTLIFRDPRIQELGLRVVCPASEDVSQLLGVERGSSYRTLRYRLGVGEGIKDIFPGESFPLESNCDYLHGVSFHKGCYIGQELTARVYHTGVVRKRLMPILLDSPINNEACAKKLEILSESGKSVGRLRSIEGLAGLGFLRITETLSAKNLSVNSTNLKAWQPSWWPKHAPKELESRDKQ